ncbi:hypothetical protein, variant [Aphanomyces astaci]|uniref:Uncharacterized protein n=1 Tax=Aphanomyces astaci TaxID=112090 RepID=W4FU28_APHAT|nr:hypothetical protein, variant [Aphanomyces astaci]ETV71000.1 hypothetical protein, variant [Aphanomyces astaci]|eukprot:XP_009839663.1 hypothetical protein, variant [Aphanomyces astaci]
MEDNIRAPDVQRYRNHSVDDDGMYRRGSIGTSSEGESSSICQPFFYRSSSISSTTSSDMRSIQGKTSLLEELKGRLEEHPLLPLVHQQLAVVHATCNVQRARMRQWKDDEIDLAMKEEDQYYDDVERFVLIIDAMQAKIESMQPSVQASVSSSIPTPPRICATTDDTSDLASARRHVAALEAAVAESRAQCQELESQASALRDVNEALSARAKSWKKAQVEKESAVERTWMERQHAATMSLQQRVDALQTELAVAQKRGESSHHQWSDLQMTHHDTLDHLKEAYRDVIDANGKLQEEHRLGLGRDAIIKKYEELQAKWATERTSLETSRHNLATELSEYRDELRRVTDELASKTLREEDLTRQVAAAAAERLQDQRENANWHDKYNVVIAKLDEAQATIMSLEATVKATTSRLDDTMSQLEFARQNAREFDDERHQAKSQVEELREALQDVQSTLAHRTQEKTDAVTSVGRLNDLHIEVVALLAEKERMLDRVSTMLGQNQQRVDQLEASIEAKDDEINRLKRQSSTTAAALDDTFQRLQAFDQLSMAYHDTRIQYEARQSEIEQLESQLRAADTSAAALQRSLLERQEQLDAAVEQRVDLEARFRELQSICHDLVAKLELAEDKTRAQSELDVRAAHDELQSAHASLQHTLHDVQRAANAKVQELEAALSGMYDSTKQKDCELAALRSDMDRLADEQNHMLANERERGERNTRALESKCAALQAKVDALQQQNSQLDALVQTHKGSCNEWRDACQEAATNAETLKRELTQVQVDKAHEISDMSERLEALEKDHKTLKARERTVSMQNTEMTQRLDSITTARDAEMHEWKVAVAQWTSSRERSQAMVDALKGAIAEKDTALGHVRRDLDHARGELLATNAQLEMATEVGQKAERRVEALMATVESLQSQVTSQSQSFQDKHVEEFENLRAACHDVSAVNRMLTTERESIHAWLQQWLANGSNDPNTSSQYATDDIQATLDRLDSWWRERLTTTQSLAETVTKLNAKLMATVDVGARFEAQVDALIHQLLDALGSHNRSNNNQTCHGDIKRAIHEAFAHAIALARSTQKETTPQTSNLTASRNSHAYKLMSTKRPQDASATVVVVAETGPSDQVGRPNHDNHVVQLNDHLTHLMQQCLALQARNEKYKKQLHTMRQREKLLERDLLLAIK